MKLSVSEENYSKAVYQLHLKHRQVSSSLLADAVHTRAASVTDMLKKLPVKKNVHHKPNKNFTPTDTGNKTALEIVRNHRLWEFFLVNKLGFQWYEVDAIAEELEQISSRELIDKLDNHLGYPPFNPHGDPIPDSKGKIAVLKLSNLVGRSDEKIGTVSYISDQSSSKLDILKHYQIKIGTKLKLTKRLEFDGSVEIKVEKFPEVLLSSAVAQNIYCVL